MQVLSVLAFGCVCGVASASDMTHFKESGLSHQGSRTTQEHVDVVKTKLFADAGNPADSDDTRVKALHAEGDQDPAKICKKFSFIPLATADTSLVRENCVGLQKICNDYKDACEAYGAQLESLKQAWQTFKDNGGGRKVCSHWQAKCQGNTDPANDPECGKWRSEFRNGCSAFLNNCAETTSNPAVPADSCNRFYFALRKWEVTMQDYAARWLHFLNEAKNIPAGPATHPNAMQDIDGAFRQIMKDTAEYDSQWAEFVAAKDAFYKDAGLDPSSFLQVMASPVSVFRGGKRVREQQQEAHPVTPRYVDARFPPASNHLPLPRLATEQTE